MHDAIRVLRVLPVVLKIAWLFLVLGMTALAAGFFMRTAWQSQTGLVCLISGYGIVLLDMLYRTKHRGTASGFCARATFRTG